MTFFYVNNRVRYIREPDEIPMDDQPEPEEVDEYDANREELDDLRLALLEIGYTPALMRRQAS